VNLGNWVVTPPATGFSVGSVSPGDNIVIGVDSPTFLVDKHTLTALTIVPGVK
jgi:hypothetical protein